MRTKDDVNNYNPTVIDYENQIEEIVQQIKMLLLTNKGEIMGFPSMGLSLETLIFNLSINNKALEKRIFNQVLLYVPEAIKMNFRVDVKFYEGTVQDMCIIDVFLRDNKQFGIVI